MINTQLKLEAGSKVIAFTRNYTKFLRFKAYMTLKVKDTSFQKHPRYLDDQWTVKTPNGLF